MDSTLALQYGEAVGGRSLLPAEPQALGQAQSQSLRTVGPALAAREKAVQIVYELGLRPANKLHQHRLHRVTGQLLVACESLEQAMPSGVDQTGISTAVAWEFTETMVPDVVPTPLLQLHRAPTRGPEPG